MEKYLLSILLVLQILLPCTGNSSCAFTHGGITVDCSGRNLTEIPKALMEVNAQEIQNLNLSHNEIKEIDSEVFNRLWNLETLQLNNNPLRKIHKFAFERLFLLRKLDLSYTLLNDLPLFTNMGFLNTINLKGNQLVDVPKEALKPLKRTLVELDLNKNKIKKIPSNAFQGFVSLNKLKIFENNIDEISPSAFREMPALQELFIHGISMTEFPNLEGTDGLTILEITNSGLRNIPRDICKNKFFLKHIILEGNKIKQIPNMTECISLKTLILDRNEITEIPAGIFQGLDNLQTLTFWINPLMKVHTKAFRNMKSLQEIDMSGVILDDFPDLTGTMKLRNLKLVNCGIKRLPSTLCVNRTSLRSLKLYKNQIHLLPDLQGCKNLRVLELDYNLIESIDGKLHGLNELLDLYLDYNKIRSLGKNTLGSTRKLQRLSMNNNELEYINPMAFSALEMIQILYLRNNRLSSFPTDGLQSLMIVETKGNPNLKDFPTYKKLPNIRKLVVDYAYHCCYYLERKIQLEKVHKAVDSENEMSVSWQWEDKSLEDSEDSFSVSPADTQPETLDENKLEALLQKLNKGLNVTLVKETSPNYRMFIPPIINEGEKHLLDSLTCIPSPDAFYPCEDLMGKEWLRVFVWFVFALALIGNIAVIVVLLASRYKFDVQKLLILNLAFADLLLGIYLGFLAIVDITTLGNFRAHAIEWQFSNRCKSAGFLAVFASELSVFTLLVITIERVIKIEYSMYLDKQLTILKASIIMIIGWIFSLVVAVLPLVRIKTDSGDIYFSDYTKYSVCLPFDVPEVGSPARIYSVAYLGFILVLNLFAFVVITGCYIRIYRTVSGSNSFNSSDARLARRMALLIFTDLACWFPIAVVALSAVFTEPMIKDLWISKVFIVFVFPLNACANPFLYSIFTNQFKEDFFSIYRQIKGGHSSVADRILQALKPSQSTYSVFRRNSSFSFLLNRRGSSRIEDPRKASRTNRPQSNSDEGNQEEINTLTVERETCL